MTKAMEDPIANNTMAFNPDIVYKHSSVIWDLILEDPNGISMEDSYRVRPTHWKLFEAKGSYRSLDCGQVTRGLMEFAMIISDK